MPCTDPIGVFDSGLGGISVLRALRLRLPGEDFLYYGDSRHAPYGDKPLEAVQALCDDAVQWLPRAWTASSQRAGTASRGSATMPCSGCCTGA